MIKKLLKKKICLQYSSLFDLNFTSRYVINIILFNFYLHTYFKAKIPIRIYQTGTFLYYLFQWGIDIKPDNIEWNMILLLVIQNCYTRLDFVVITEPTFIGRWIIKICKKKFNRYLSNSILLNTHLGI